MPDKRPPHPLPFSQLPRRKTRKFGNDSYEALRGAVLNGSVEQVQALLKRGAQVNYVSINSGPSLLMLAAAQGHADVVRVLCDADAEIEGRDIQRATALACAARGGHLGVVQILLERGAKVNHVSVNGYSALILAAAQGHADVVRVLCDADAEIEGRDIKGATALAHAAQGGHLSVVQVLLELGAARHVLVEGFNPLMLAAARGHAAVVCALLDSGANIYPVSMLGNELQSAAKNGHLGVVQVLLDRGIDNYPLIIRCQALYLAAGHGHLEIVEKLLEADTSYTPEDVSLALRYACEYGHANVSGWLLDKGAKISNDALRLAVANGHLDVARVLLERDADINRYDANRASLLILAANKGHDAIFNMLFEHPDLKVAMPQVKQLLVTDERCPEKNLIGKISQIVQRFSTLADGLSVAEKNRITLHLLNSSLRDHLLTKITQPITRVDDCSTQLMKQFLGDKIPAESPLDIVDAVANLCAENARLRMALALERGRPGNGREEVVKPRPTSQTSRENQERLNLARPVGFFNGKNHKPAAIEPRERKIREVTSVSMPKEGWQPHPAP